MEVILLERVEKLGQMGDTVSVKDGFARNFLLPQNKAMRATKENVAFFETQKAQLEAENLKRREEAEAVAEKAKGTKVLLIRAASEKGQLYGSVNSRDIADAVTEEGVTIARSQVVLNNPIKNLGISEVAVRLHPEVYVTVLVNVARSSDEAISQMAAFEAGETFDPNAAAAAEDAAATAELLAAAEEAAAEAEAEGHGAED